MLAAPLPPWPRRRARPERARGPGRARRAFSARRARAGGRRRDDGRDTSTASIAVLVVSVIAQTTLTWFARRSSFVLSEQVFARLREDFMRQVLALPLSVVERAGTGDLVSRTTARRRHARAHGPLRHPGDADLRRDGGADGRRGLSRQPGHGAVVHRRAAGDPDRDAVVPAPRAGGLPLGARRVRDDDRHRRGNG